MTKRTDRIIHVLLNRSNGTTVRELSKILNVSERTIRNEVKSINSNLINIDLPIIDQNRGAIKLDLTEKQLEKIYSSNLIGDDADYYTPNERFIILLFDLLNNEKITRVYQEQEKLKISKSTIDDDMRYLRKFLKDYSLSAISNQKDGMEITGNERSIRTMLSDVITQYTDISNLITENILRNDVIATEIKTFFENIDIQKIAKIYSKSIHQIGSYGNTANDYQVILLTSIWIKRLEDKKMIIGESHDQWGMPNDSISIYINSIVKEFNLVKIEDSEYRFIYFIINSFNTRHKVTNATWTKTQLLTIQLITYMEGEQGIPYSSQEDLYEGLYSHLVGVIYRLDENVNSYNPLKQTIKANYPDIYNLVSAFMKNYFEGFKNEISDDEIGYITVYFTTAQMQIDKSRKRKYKVAVICNYGLATGHLLAANLEKKFNIEVVAVLSVADARVLSKLSLDLVVKTVQVNTGEVPSIKLPPIPQERDYLIVQKFFDNNPALIKKNLASDFNQLFEDVIQFMDEHDLSISGSLIKELANVFQKNNVHITSEEVQPMLHDLLTDDKIQLQVQVENWKEAIEKASQPLIDDGTINQHYVHAMLESVVKFGPYIVIGPGLALAHARPEEGADKLGVSVMTLKTPVRFGNKDNDPVSVVFCLSAVNNYSHLNVMKSVVRLIAEPGRIEAISKIKDLDQFKKELFKSEMKVK